jgi:hypothetical protein
MKNPATNTLVKISRLTAERLERRLRVEEPAKGVLALSSLTRILPTVSE